MSSVEANKEVYKEIEREVLELRDTAIDIGSPAIAIDAEDIFNKLLDLEQYLFPPNAKSYYTGEKE